MSSIGVSRVWPKLCEHRLDLLEHPGALVCSQWNDRAAPHALRAIRNDLVQRHFGHLAEAAAARACAVRAVEAEQVRLRLLVADAAGRAHQVTAQVARHVRLFASITIRWPLPYFIAVAQLSASRLRLARRSRSPSAGRSPVRCRALCSDRGVGAR